MTDDKNVHIKLELCKDKNSGKINLIARFNNKAPNVKFENSEYFWIPTTEEKDLINEAFELVPSLKTKTTDTTDYINKEEPSVSTDDKGTENTGIFGNNTTPKEEPPVQASANNYQNNSIEPNNPTYNADNTSNSSDNSKDDLKKIDEPAIFQITGEDKKENSEPNLNNPKVNINSDKTSENTNKNNENQDNKKDDAIIVEADNDAIKAALKKHKNPDDDEDNTIVEADEKTIIDRVLKQKKKGKWSKK